MYDFKHRGALSVTSAFLSGQNGHGGQVTCGLDICKVVNAIGKNTNFDS